MALHTVRIYLIDTSRGWLGAGALSEVGFGQARQQAIRAAAQGVPVADLAGQQLGLLGAARPEAGDPKLEAGLAAAAMALCLTECYKKASFWQVHGHWLFIGYRGRDGSMVCRPVWLVAQDLQFMAADAVFGVVRQVMDQDFGNPSSSVSKEVKRAGGVVLAEMFKA
jgi:hypothetical protein